MSVRKQAMRGTAANTPEEWMALWSGWPKQCAQDLRSALLDGAPFDLSIKWGNLLFTSNGICAVIHVEEARVILALFRGKRLKVIEPAIMPSGKYELGNLVFRPGDSIDQPAISRLAAAAANLNAELGDPAKHSSH